LRRTPCSWRREFSFITVDRSTVERQAEAGDRRSAGLLKGLRSLSTQLSGAQLGITVTRAWSSGSSPNRRSRRCCAARSV